MADIANLRPRVEFVNLAVILDACSRRVIGWSLGRTLQDKLTLEAPPRALQRRRPAPGPTHHCDRGVQHASRDYTPSLPAHGIASHQNVVQRESLRQRRRRIVYGTSEVRKYGGVYRHNYEDLREARTAVRDSSNRSAMKSGRIRP